VVFNHDPWSGERAESSHCCAQASPGSVITVSGIIKILYIYKYVFIYTIIYVTHIYMNILGTATAGTSPGGVSLAGYLAAV